MAIIARRVAQLKQLAHSVFDAATVRGACVELDHQWRDRLLDPVMTLHLFLLQILHGNVACRCVRHLAEMDFSPTAYSQARKRLPLALFKQLAHLLVAKAIDSGPTPGLWHGLRVLLIDGSGASMPDTAALQQRFGQPGRVKAGCGFPVMHVLWLFDAATGMVLDLIPNRCHTHDLADAPLLHPALRRGDLLVGDRGFCSFAHLALLAQRGVHAVFRVHQKQIVDFRKNRRCRQQCPKGQRRGRPTSRYVKYLGKHDQLVRWVKPKRKPAWMSDADYAALPDELLLRELRYTTPKRKGYRSKTITIVTTLTDAETYPKDELAELYHARWQIEVDLRHLKQTMGMDVLRCKTADGVLKELWVYMMVYNLVRLSILEAAGKQGCDPDRISFIDALDTLRYRGRDAPIADLMVNPDRPGRNRPRRIKRRKDRYTYLTQPMTRAA